MEYLAYWKMSKAERTSLFEKEKRGRELTFLSVYYMLGTMLHASWSQWTILGPSKNITS